MSGDDLMVRMGEFAVSPGPCAILTSLGLGSCVGLALVDADRQVAGLAHVMLPSSPDGRPGAAIGKFGDTAVPALLGAVIAAGARRTQLSTYIVGGAQMFRFGANGLKVGDRNETAVRAALSILGLRVRGAATGGKNGRTVRVFAADGRVTVRESGGPTTDLGRTPYPPGIAPLPQTTEPARALHAARPINPLRGV